MTDLARLGAAPAVSRPLDSGSLDTDLVPLFLLRYEAPNTRRAYANDLRQFFQSDAVTLRMARATTFVHVNEHLASLREAGARPRTLQRRTAALRTFFGWLQALKLLDGNPADRHLVRRIKRNRQDNEALTVLTRDQAFRIFDALHHADNFRRETFLQSRVFLEQCQNVTQRGVRAFLTRRCGLAHGKRHDARLNQAIDIAGGEVALHANAP